MTRGNLFTGVALLLTAATALAPCRAEGLPSSKRTTADGVVCSTVNVVGELRSYALPRRSIRQRELVAVLAESRALPTDPEPSTPIPSCSAGEESAVVAPAPSLTLELVRLVNSDPPRLDTLRSDLPLDTTGIVAFDIDGDGIDELLVATLHGADLLRAGSDGAWSGPISPWIVDPALHWTPEPIDTSHDPRDRDDRLLLIPSFGRVRVFAGAKPDLAITSDSDGDRKATNAVMPALEIDSLPLPRLVRNDPRGLLLLSPPVKRIGQRGDGHVLFATKPGVPMAQRFGVTLLDPLAVGLARAQELFLRLPSRERILEWQYLMDGDNAWLAVTSTSATELKLFGEKLLRLYPLEPDRTRGGAAPGLALESRMNLWQSATFALSDINGDGRRDLSAAYWKGLKDDTLTIDVYLRQADGNFARSPRTTSFDLEEADRGLAMFGPDVDGDGRADLIVRHAGDQLSIYPAAPNDDGRGVVAKQPRWTVRSLRAGQSGLNFTVGSDGNEGTTGLDFETSSLPAPLLSDIDGDGILDLVEVVSVDPSKSALQTCLLRATGAR